MVEEGVGAVGEGGADGDQVTRLENVDEVLIDPIQEIENNQEYISNALIQEEDGGRAAAESSQRSSSASKS